MSVTSKPSGEPLVTAASITAAVTAAIALLVAFGVPVTDEQAVAILGVVGVAAPLVVAALARGKVSPVATMGGDVDESPVLDTDGNDLEV